MMAKTIKITRSPIANRHEVSNILSSIFAIELLKPGRELWIVSPWISDIEILDNTAGNFSSIVPTFERRQIKLSEIIRELVNKGCKVHIVFRPIDTNRYFLQNLNDIKEKLELKEIEMNEVHEKGLLSESFYLEGSMNFTYNGVHINIEKISFTLEREEIQQAFFQFRRTYIGGENGN